MADGRDQITTPSIRSLFPWIEIFRCFQIALDPRKLFVAALGILVMSFVWWLLSTMFWYKAPDKDDREYETGVILDKYKNSKKPGTNEPYGEDDARKEGKKQFEADFEQWKVLDSLAGPGGTLRTLPWSEYHGPNPYLFVTDQLLNQSAWDAAKVITEYISKMVPVLIEPLFKLLLPVFKFFSPGVSFQTRVYLLLILLSNIAIWAFCGGVITRLAAVQLANKGPMSIKQAVKFVANRYLAYLGAPIVPIAIIGVVGFCLLLYGILNLIPAIGDVVFMGIGFPVIVIGGAIMAVFLIGLLGYPLMYTTLSAEGDQSDTFDALSRSINYVYQCPWHYLWYWLVATVYGAAVTLFVVFFTSLAVYAGKWAVGIPASAVWSDRKPEYLFIYAPESFGWRQLLTKDSPYAVFGARLKPNKNPDREYWVDLPVNAEADKQGRADYLFYNSWGAGLVCFWLTLIFLLMLGFTYSFFWSAATMIYFLMRKKVDESEMDEVFIEDDEPAVPPAPPKIAEGTGPAPASPTSLPVISNPMPPAVPPPTASVSPTLPPKPLVESPPVAPPTTIPFSTPPATLETPKPTDELKKDNPPPLI